MTAKPPTFKVRSSNHGNYAMVGIEKVHELNSKHLETLQRFKEKGWVEFRNYRYDDPTEEHDARLCYEMVEMEILESDGMSWNLTFRLTDVGKAVVSQLL